MTEIVRGELEVLAAIRHDLAPGFPAQVYLANFLDTCRLYDGLVGYTVSIPVTMAKELCGALHDWVSNGNESGTAVERAQRAKSLYVKFLQCGVPEQSNALRFL